MPLKWPTDSPIFQKYQSNGAKQKPIHFPPSVSTILHIYVTVKEELSFPFGVFSWT